MQSLRKLFPLQDGAIFNVTMVRKGLENLRKAYGELGYIDFTSVPDTEIDEQTQAISLVIDVDEDRQYQISGVKVIGLGDGEETSALREFSLTPGHVDNTRLEQQFFEKYASGLTPDSVDEHVHHELDGVNHTVVLTFNFRCVVEQ